MTRRFGIDTSSLVRLLTGDPAPTFDRCVRRLRELADEGSEVFASNQVIGETYVAVQHHYGVAKEDARTGLSRSTTGSPTWSLTLDERMARLPRTTLLA